MRRKRHRFWYSVLHIGKFFVAYLLTGEAKSYHQALTRALASRYRIYPLHERVLPHITVKAPFETDEDGIQEVERVLRAFAHQESATPFTIKGFGRFGFKTIYLDVHKSSDATALVRRAIQTLNENISWMPRAPLEGNKLHASVARFMDRRQSRRVMRYVSHEAALFKSTLDNIAILKKEGSAWKVMTVVSLDAQNEGANVLLPSHADTLEQKAVLVS